jgi:hypothetical protein
MKHTDILIIIFLLALLTSLAVFSAVYIGKSAAQVADNFPAIAAAIAGEEWSQARALFAASRQRWQQVRKIWPMLINHDDMKDVEISFVALDVLLQQQDRERATQEIANLHYHLSHVPNNESFTWQNIL